MPELPDVETFRHYLDATSLHKPVDEVALLDKELLGDADAEDVRSTLRGHAFGETFRHGKYLFAHADDTAWLVLHFGMTGRLKSFEKGEAPDHTRLLLDFEGGRHLAYLNQRKLGSIDLTDEPSTFIDEHDLGPDTLDLGWPAFMKALDGRRGGVKSTLMDQSVIAGIGNVYADEICFQTGVRPETRLPALDEDLLRSLHRTMRRVLRTAVDRKADPDKLPRTWLLPRRREGASCPRCDGKIVKKTVAGRPTYLCPSCQSEH